MTTEIRVPEKEAYDWLQGINKHKPMPYPRSLKPCGRYSKVEHHYTDSNTMERVFVVSWAAMPASSREEAITFAKSDPKKFYWALRKKHRNDDDGEAVIGWRC